MWNRVLDKKGVTELNKIFGGFHDSSIKEMRYISGAYVSEDLSMLPINKKRNLYVIFQRQAENPAVIEILFEGVSCLHLCPLDQKYTCEIFDCYFDVVDDTIYWADSSDFAINQEYDGTWVAAESLCWRTADEYLGNRIVYGNNNN